jgi:hypothetical protein
VLNDEIVKAAYCVTRVPELRGAGWTASFERIQCSVKPFDGMKAPSFEGFRAVRRTDEDLFSAPFSIRLSEWQQHNMQELSNDKVVCAEDLNDPKYQSPGFAASLNGYTLQEPIISCPVTHPADLNGPRNQASDYPVHNLPSMSIPKSGSWDAEFSPEGFTSFDVNGEDAIDLSTFDYELACLPLFDTQLQEYMETYGISDDEMCLGLPIEIETKLQKWEGDRLQIWPEKVVPGLEMFEEYVKLEEEGGSDWLWGLETDFGEAEDYMDMRDIEGIHF